MSDLISRQAAIDALTGWETEPLDEDIVRTLENLPTIEVSEDCISLQQAINAVENTDIEIIEAEWNELTNALNNLPPVTPTERTGEWVDRNDDDVWNYCSVCGEQSIDLFDYCPNCGAKMRGEE